MDDGLSMAFEEHRAHLRAVAYRVLGSPTDADDAVQEAWLRARDTEPDDIQDLRAWLTTVVARVSLNMLRSRRRRRERPLELAFATEATDRGVEPEAEAVLADSVGLALLVVLDTLTPAERLAFVLHDMFDLPFDEISPIVGRSPAAARQLASRARRRVRGTEPPEDDSLRRGLVSAYLAATREGDFEALLRILDPDVELHADAHAVPSGRPVTLHGATTVARMALASVDRARVTQEAVVDGALGLVMAVEGRLALAMTFVIDGDRITGIDVVADPERLAGLRVAVPGEPPFPDA